MSTATRRSQLRSARAIDAQDHRAIVWTALRLAHHSQAGQLLASLADTCYTAALYAEVAQHPRPSRSVRSDGEGNRGGARAI